ncbi:MAG: sugar phosphate isomerase/epimerase [Alphaproteobacteria bacterium]|nr:sugar phosphate isomerase/epimerase [Alphaproteobacteria bacterium]
MRIALCNEVIGEMAFDAQCRFAAELGYDGLEVAPFTLGEEPHRLPASTISAARTAAADAGIAITGLHWLLVEPKGLSITSDDGAVFETTLDVGLRLVELCAELGGSVLVHGSPKQRMLPTGDDGKTKARARAASYFEAVGRAAEAAGVIYCVEPLGAAETNFINTVADAASLIDGIGVAGLKTMVDTKAALQDEAQGVPELLDAWLPTGAVAHIQLNDADGSAPGQGNTGFGPIIAALARNAYAGVVAIEPFVYKPSGAAVAARAIGYLRGLEEQAL